MTAPIIITAEMGKADQAWANGLRPLGAPDRRGRATAARSLRYSAVLWLANGSAFWLVAVLTQF